MHPRIDPAGARSVVRMRVRFAETDLMGIVHHGSYALYLEQARVEWLRRRGVFYADWAGRGNHLAVAELHVRFRAPARFDDELDVETTLAHLGAASMRFDYRVTRHPDGALLAEAHTLLACVDDKGALRRVSPEWIEVCSRSERS